MAEAVLAAATGRTLVTMDNLYVFDEHIRTMARGHPDATERPQGRAASAMTEKALAAHAAGTLRYAEARASDFFGPGTDREDVVPHGARCCPGRAGASGSSCRWVTSTPPTPGPSCPTSAAPSRRSAPTPPRPDTSGTCRATRRGRRGRSAPTSPTWPG